MSENLSSRDKARLVTLARVRGARAETLIRYPNFKGDRSTEAERKALDRLCDKGYLAASPMPSGSQLYRLSTKGVAFTGAPPAYAGSPSAGIAAEMIAVSSLAWRTDEFLFPTKAELEELFAALPPDSEKPKWTGRFVLRRVKAAGTDAWSELHLHVFVAELRPPDDLAKRAEVVIGSLRRFPIFRDLISANLLGVTLAVPSRGVKASLEGKTFAAETSVVVVEELQDLIAH